MWPRILGEYLEIHPKYENVVDLGGASAAGMVWRAAAAIQAGMCSAVLCVTGEASDVETFYTPRARKPTQQLPGARVRRAVRADGRELRLRADRQRHMSEYGTTCRQLAKIAADQRTNACANPDALFYGKPLTVDDVLDSPLVVDPLHLLEIVRPCTGGAASSSSRRRSRSGRRRRRVWLLGAGECDPRD